MSRLWIAFSLKSKTSKVGCEKLGTGSQRSRHSCERGFARTSFNIRSGCWMEDLRKEGFCQLKCGWHCPWERNTLLRIMCIMLNNLSTQLCEHGCPFPVTYALDSMNPRNPAKSTLPPPTSQPFSHLLFHKPAKSGRILITCLVNTTSHRSGRKIGNRLVPPTCPKT